MQKDLDEAACAITEQTRRKVSPRPPKLVLDKSIPTSASTTTIQMGIHQATMPFVPGAFQKDFLGMIDPRIEELKRAADGKNK